MDWADHRNIGYLAWAWWVLPDEGCSNFALIDDLSGEPSRPYGVAFRNHLTAFGGQPGSPPPRPIVRRRPELRIAAARVKKKVPRTRPRVRKFVKARLRVRPEATGWIHTRIEFRKRRSLRQVRQRVKAYDGLGILRKELPQHSRPVRLFVRYPGDHMLLPEKTSRTLKSR